MVEKLKKSEAEWQKILPAEVFEVTRRKGTEPPFSGVYNDFKEPGIYRCACCGAALFSSDAKYASGSGWPSFWQPLDAEALIARRDLSHGMERVEVACARCDAHLGHLFPDGPPPTGQRYCLNSLSLNFEPKKR